MGRGDSTWSWDLGTVARELSEISKPRSALWLSSLLVIAGKHESLGDLQIFAAAYSPGD